MRCLNKLQLSCIYSLIYLSFILSTINIPQGEISIDGICTRVIDGDSIELSDGRRRYRIRLKYIDAPELKQQSFDQQPIGQWSRDFLTKLILHRAIKVVYSKRGIYGRILGEIYLDGRSINLQMIQQGQALLYPYSTFSSRLEKHKYVTMRYLAMQQRRGFWATEGLLHPKEFRKRKRL